MKKATLGLVTSCVFSALAYAGPDQYSGKEMKQVAPMPPDCDYDWTGFYIGANAGYGWSNGDTHFEPLPSADSFESLEPITVQPDPSGFVGGGQVGYNQQAGKFVIGAEADLQWSDMEGTTTVSPIIANNGTPEGPDSFLEAHEKTDWFGTFRLRIGFTPVCRLLVYATGGFAFGQVNYAAVTSYDSPDYISSFDRVKLGWIGGGGLEYALSHRWSLKAEYLYYDLGNQSATADAVPANPPFQVRYDWDTTAHIVRGGLNFKF